MESWSLKMDIEQQKNYITMGTALLAATKLACESFGVHFISNEQINALANLASIAMVITGVVMTHIKKV
jgi:uncharacterized membrane protein